MANLHRTVLFVVLNLAIFNSALLRADTDPDHWTAVSDQSLASLRAGFMLDNGMVVDIALSKRLFINAEQVGETLYLSNSHSDDLWLSDTSLSHFVQNTLDNQILSSITHLDIAVSNLTPVQQHLAQEVLYETLFTGPLQF